MFEGMVPSMARLREIQEILNSTIAFKEFQCFIEENKNNDTDKLKDFIPELALYNLKRYGIDENLTAQQALSLINESFEETYKDVKNKINIYFQN